MVLIFFKISEDVLMSVISNRIVNFAITTINWSFWSQSQVLEASTIWRHRSVNDMMSQKCQQYQVKEASSMSVHRSVNNIRPHKRQLYKFTEASTTSGHRSVNFIKSQLGCISVNDIKSQKCQLYQATEDERNYCLISLVPLDRGFLLMILLTQKWHTHRTHYNKIKSRDICDTLMLPLDLFYRVHKPLLWAWMEIANYWNFSKSKGHYSVKNCSIVPKTEIT
jgi:hypothetical protein